MTKWIALLLCLSSSAAFAQQTTNITATDSSTGVRVQLADSVARTIRITIKDASGNPFATAGNPLRIDPTGTTTQPTAGNVASGATDSGNPIKIGAIFNTTQPTVTNGQRVDGQATARGGLIVATGIDVFSATVSQGTASSLNATIVGGKTNNNAAPGSTNLGVLPVLANASPPSWTEGNQVSLSSDLAGNLRVNVMNGSNTVTDAATQSTGASSVATTESYQFGYSPISTSYTRIYADPCAANSKTYLPFTQATSTQIITGTASKKIYLCSFTVVAAAAENISVVSGTGSVCATNTVADIGATTAANGLNFAANGGVTIGNGASSIAATTVNADNMCILQAGSVRLGGVITYVVQ